MLLNGAARLRVPSNAHAGQRKVCYGAGWWGSHDQLKQEPACTSHAECARFPLESGREALRTSAVTRQAEASCSRLFPSLTRKHVHLLQSKEDIASWFAPRVPRVYNFADGSYRSGRSKSETRIIDIFTNSLRRHERDSRSALIDKRGAESDLERGLRTGHADQL